MCRERLQHYDGAFCTAPPAVRPHLPRSEGKDAHHAYFLTTFLIACFLSYMRLVLFPVCMAFKSSDFSFHLVTAAAHPLARPILAGTASPSILFAEKWLLKSEGCFPRWTSRSLATPEARPGALITFFFSHACLFIYLVTSACSFSYLILCCLCRYACFSISAFTSSQRLLTFLPVPSALTEPHSPFYGQREGCYISRRPPTGLHSSPARPHKV